MAHDKEQIRRFLEYLEEGRHDEWPRTITLGVKLSPNQPADDRRSLESFTFATMQAAADHAASLDNYDGVFVQAQVAHPNAPANQRLANRDILRYRYIVLDLDPLKGRQGEAEAQKYPAAERVNAIIADLGMPSAAQVDSGIGWLFLVPCDLPVGEETSNLLKRLYGGINKKLADLPWALDVGVHDATRLIGLPGTENRKNDQRRLRRIVALPAVTSRVSLDDLRRMVAACEPPLPPPSPIRMALPIPLGDPNEKELRSSSVFWAIVYRRYPRTVGGLREALIDAGFEPLGDQGNEGVYVKSPNRTKYSTAARDTDLLVYLGFNFKAFHSSDQNLWSGPQDFVERFLPSVWAEYEQAVEERHYSKPGVTDWGVPSASDALGLVEAAEAPRLPVLPRLRSEADCDANYTPELLSFRNKYFADKKTIRPEQRQYGLLTHALLGTVRAIAGKRLICVNADDKPIYAGTGCTLIAAPSGAGKTAIIETCKELYSRVTGLEPHERKTTMHQLLKDIAAAQGCVCAKDQFIGKDKAKPLMLCNPNSFTCFGDEFVRKFEYILQNWNTGGSGGEEDRFNQLLDDRSTIGHGAGNANKVMLYDNCFHIVSALLDEDYSNGFNPFLDEQKIASGLTARLNVMFDSPMLRAKGIVAYDHHAVDHDVTLLGVARESLTRLFAIKDAIVFEAEGGVIPVEVLDKNPLCVSFAALNPDIYRSLRYKRMRDAVRETMILQLLGDPSLLERAEKAALTVKPVSRLTTWDHVPPHEVLRELVRVPLDVTLLERRLKSQATNMVNHYLAFSELHGQNPYVRRIENLLKGVEKGLTREHLSRKIDAGGRCYRAVGEALDLVVAKGEVVLLRQPNGKGRPTELYRHRCWLQGAA